MVNRGNHRLNIDQFRLTPGQFRVVKVKENLTELHIICYSKDNWLCCQNFLASEVNH